VPPIADSGPENPDTPASVTPHVSITRIASGALLLK
jgi:hypothetical protein